MTKTFVVSAGGVRFSVQAGNANAALVLFLKKLGGFPSGAIKVTSC